MPPFPGEERLVTVFADCHYFFAQPTLRPLLHRFDKSSYFYIYYNATRQTSRIEIANNPGTAEQDAVNGYIGTCRITNSERFPTRLTIEVDGSLPQSPTPPKSGRDPQEWHLSTGDSREPDRRWKVHTLDVYLWAQDDARLVVECLRRLLPASQLDVPDDDHAQTAETIGSAAQPNAATSMSPVVQNLENMAVHDPEYNGQHRSQAPVSPSPPLAGHDMPPLPPMAGVNQPIDSPSPAISDLSSSHAQQSSLRREQAQPSNFTPMAYNPAAPHAPEPIAHRDKTPPPDDHEGGTGLSHAVSTDQGYRPGPSNQPSNHGGYRVGQGAPQTFGGGYASPPPQFPGGHAQQPSRHTPNYATSPPPTTAASHYGSPPPPAGYSYSGQSDQRSSAGSGVQSFGPRASSTTQPDPRSSATSTVPSFGPGAPSTISQQPPSHNHSSAAETYSPIHAHDPIPTPGTQFYSSLPPSNKPLTHVQPQYADYFPASGTPGQATSANSTSQPPPGGYSQYNYGQSSQQPHHGQSNPYAVHQQVYRPTEAEASGHHRKPNRTSGSARKDSTVDKVENRAKGLFKKVEKYF